MFLHVSVILFTGGVPGQVTPRAGTPPTGTRPGAETTLLGQTSPPEDKSI